MMRQPPYAFDLIELAGDDRRRDPLEQRKFDLSRLLADDSPGLVLNSWADGDIFDGATVFERRGMGHAYDRSC
jgi:ATP-dependent DNA ligase